MCELKKYNNTSNTQIDKCMRRLIAYLKDSTSYKIIASCCGHNKYPMTIVVSYKLRNKDFYYELLSWTQLDRTRRFYRKDKQGYFYIPELIKELEHEK